MIIFYKFIYLKFLLNTILDTRQKVKIICTTPIED